MRGSAAGRSPPKENPPAKRNAHCQNRGRLQRSLTSTTTAISSTFMASLFPPSAQPRPIRSLTGRAGPTRRAPQTRSEQAGVHQHRPEPSDLAAPGGEPNPACVITHRGQSSEQPWRRTYGAARRRSRRRTAPTRVTGLHRKDMCGKIDRRGDVRLSQRLDPHRSLRHPTGRPRRSWTHIGSPGCAATLASHSAQCTVQALGGGVSRGRGRLGENLYPVAARAATAYIAKPCRPGLNCNPPGGWLPLR